MVHEVIRRGTFVVCLFGSALALPACGSDKDDDAMKETEKAECSSEMFDKYGADAFLAVRDSIVAKALAAPTAELGDSFASFAGSASEEQIQVFQDHLAAFLVMVYGGPSSYSGRTMQQAHAGLGITSDQYDYFITEVVVPALSENGVPSDDISNCFAPPVTDADFKASIVGQ
jgi:hemoglobin